MLIILTIEVLATDVDAKVGSPVAFDPSVSASTAPKQPEQPRIPEPQQRATSNNGASSGAYFSGVNVQLENSLTPIKNINPYQSR